MPAYVTASFVFSMLLASAGLCCLLVTAGWRRRPGPPPAAPPAGDSSQNMEAVLRAAAEHAASLAGRHTARIDIAVRPGLTLPTNAAALRAILTDMVLCALRDAPCGRVLLSAAPMAGRMRIAVSDDGLATARAVREAALRPASERAALQGGSMRIDTHPGQGTTVALHLPLPLAPVVSRAVVHQDWAGEDRSDARDTPPEPVVRPQPVQAGDFQRQL